MIDRTKLLSCRTIQKTAKIGNAVDGMRQDGTRRGRTGRSGTRAEESERRGGSISAGLSNLTIDHASISRRSTVPSPSQDISSIWAFLMVLPGGIGQSGAMYNTKHDNQGIVETTK